MRLTPAEKAMVQQKADDKGMSVTAFVLDTIMSAEDARDMKAGIQSCQQQIYGMRSSIDALSATIISLIDTLNYNPKGE